MLHSKLWLSFRSNVAVCYTERAEIHPQVKGALYMLFPMYSHVLLQWWMLKLNMAKV